MTDVLTRHGSAHSHMTWVLLTPLAAPVLRATAAALAERDVRLTWYDPTAGAKFKRHNHAGRLQANDHRTTAAIGTAGHRVGQTAIRDLKSSALGNSGRATNSQFIALAKGVPTTMARLRLAADLLDAGHDVMLYATDTQFHIQLDTTNCICATCTPAAAKAAA